MRENCTCATEIFFLHTNSDNILPFSRDKLYNEIDILIIATPAKAAEEIFKKAVAGNVKGIWNFAPVHLDVPQNILVQNENMATSLAVLSMHLQAQIKEQK